MPSVSVAPRPALCGAGVVVIALALSVSTACGQGDLVGSQSLGDLAAPSVIGGNINSGSAFTIGNLVTTGPGSGHFTFTGMSGQIFGAISFDVNVPASLAFGSADFGTFQSTAITEMDNDPGERSLLFEGLYTPGSAGTLRSLGGVPAEFTVSFTQTPVGTGALSFNGTLAVNAVSPVPEPSTVALAGSAGLVAALEGWRRRRRRTAGRRGPGEGADRHPGYQRASAPRLAPWRKSVPLSLMAEPAPASVPKSHCDGAKAAFVSQ